MRNTVTWLTICLKGCKLQMVLFGSWLGSLTEVMESEHYCWKTVILKKNVKEFQEFRNIRWRRNHFSSVPLKCRESWLFGRAVKGGQCFMEMSILCLKGLWQLAWPIVVTWEFDLSVVVDGFQL